MSGNFRSILSLTINGSKILAGADRGNIYLSPDLGQNWRMVSAGVDPPKRYVNQISVLNITVAGKTSLFAGTNNGLFVSTNRGQTWRPTGIFHQVTILRLIGSSIFAVAGGRLFISRDNGMNWVASMDKGYFVNAITVKDGRIYIIHTALAGKDNDIHLENKGVYISTDDGRSWTPINDDLPELDVQGLAVNDTHLFVTTESSRLFARRF